ncbi:hypothetical protein [Microbacterium sp. HJ5]
MSVGTSTEPSFAVWAIPPVAWILSTVFTAGALKAVSALLAHTGRLERDSEGLV